MFAREMRNSVWNFGSSVLTVGALEVVVVGGWVDVAFVAQVLDGLVHIVAIHPATNLSKNNVCSIKFSIQRKYLLSFKALISFDFQEN